MPQPSHARGPAQKSPYVYSGTTPQLGHPFQVPALDRAAATARVADNVAERERRCRLNPRMASCQGISVSPTPRKVPQVSGKLAVAALALPTRIAGLSSVLIGWNTFKKAYASLYNKVYKGHGSTMKA